MTFVECSTKVDFELRSPFLSLPLFLFFRFPLRAYARVVLRGLPASETSHHLWSKHFEERRYRKMPRFESSCARETFFLPFLSSVNWIQRGVNWKQGGDGEGLQDGEGEEGKKAKQRRRREFSFLKCLSLTSLLRSKTSRRKTPHLFNPPSSPAASSLFSTRTRSRSLRAAPPPVHAPSPCPRSRADARGGAAVEQVDDDDGLALLVVGDEGAVGCCCCRCLFFFLFFLPPGRELSLWCVRVPLF